MPTKTDLKKREAVSLFLAGKTETEVAEEIGVSRQTIWNWKRDEDFNHDIVEAGESILADHASAVAKLVDEAIVAMSELLKSNDESMKFKVAMTVLNTAKNWGHLRPAAPGHSKAVDEIDEERVQALVQMGNLKHQFQMQGGKPEDFMMWVLQGKHEENGNGAEAAESTKSKGTEKSESANTPD